MDPNATLEAIRRLLATEEYTDLAELVRGLDDWMSRGGFAPAVWQRGRLAVELRQEADAIDATLAYADECNADNCKGANAAAYAALSNQDEPPCECGHACDDHNYDPSGVAGSHCRWSESFDEDGWPVGAGCPCEDYDPERIEAGAKALWEAHPYLMEDYALQWFYKVAAVVLAAGDAARE